MTVTVQDLPKTLTDTPEINVYGPPSCPNCAKTIAHLHRHNFEATKIDLVAGDANHRWITEELGFREAPVVVVHFAAADAPTDEPLIWNGLRQDLLFGLYAIDERDHVSTALTEAKIRHPSSGRYR